MDVPPSGPWFQQPSGTLPGAPAARTEHLRCDPALDELHRERDELRAANHGSPTARNGDENEPPPVRLLPPPDKVFTVLALLVCLNAAKLCLLVWVLFTVLGLDGRATNAEASRSRLAVVEDVVRRQTEQNGDRIQRLNDRVDLVLSLLGRPVEHPER